jgi:hypothetical protein
MGYNRYIGGNQMPTMRAFCGAVCDECPALVATVKKDRTAQEKLAKVWSGDLKVLTGRDRLTADEMSCWGCMNPGDHFLGCQRCEIRTCAMDRGVENCGRCEDYASCDSIQSLLEKHPRLRAGLEKER